MMAIMRMIVTVRMLMSMAVIVAVWLGACVVVGVFMPVTEARMARRGGMLIRAAFRLEPRLQARDRAAEPARHLLDDRVGRDADTVCENLRRHVPVSDVPGESRQMMRVRRRDVGDRLVRRHHADDAAVFQEKPIAMPEMRGLGQIEQEDKVALRPHGDATPMAAVMREDDGVEGRAVGQFGGGNHGFGARRGHRHSSTNNVARGS
jgi:hypothetical protein